MRRGRPDPPPRLAETRRPDTVVPAREAVMTVHSSATPRFATHGERVRSGAERRGARAAASLPVEVTPTERASPCAADERSGGPRADLHRPWRRSRYVERWPLMASAGVIVLVLLLIGPWSCPIGSRGPEEERARHRPPISTPAPSAAPTGTPSTSNGASAVPRGDAGSRTCRAAARPRINADPRATPSSSARSRSGGEDACGLTDRLRRRRRTCRRGYRIVEQAPTTRRRWRRGARRRTCCHRRMACRWCAPARAGAVVRDEEPRTHAPCEILQAWSNNQGNGVRNGRCETSSRAVPGVRAELCHPLCHGAGTRSLLQHVRRGGGARVRPHRRRREAARAQRGTRLSSPI